MSLPLMKNFVAQEFEIFKNCLILKNFQSEETQLCYLIYLSNVFFACLISITLYIIKLRYESRKPVGKEIEKKFGYMMIQIITYNILNAVMLKILVPQCEKKNNEFINYLYISFYTLIYVPTIVGLYYIFERLLSILVVLNSFAMVYLAHNCLVWNSHNYIGWRKSLCLILTFFMVLGETTIIVKNLVTDRFICIKFKHNDPANS